MATKTPIITDEEQQQRLDEAYQRLVDSLDQRKNRVFDPTWMAAAQAFATPSKTGSAFEAIGRVAGAVGKAQEAEQAQEQGIAQKMFEIERQRIEMAQKRNLYDEAVKIGRGESAPGGLPQAAPQPAPPSPLAAAAPGFFENPQAEPVANRPQKTQAAEPRPDFVTSPLQQAAAAPSQIKQTPIDMAPPQPAPITAAPPAAAPSPLSAASPSTAQTPAASFAAANAAASKYNLSPDARKLFLMSFRDSGDYTTAMSKAQEYDKKAHEMAIAERNALVNEANSAQNAVRVTTGGNLMQVSPTGTVTPLYLGSGNKTIINGKEYLANPREINDLEMARHRGNWDEVQNLEAKILGQAEAPPSTPPATPTGPLSAASKPPKPPTKRESVEEAAARIADEESKRKINESVKTEQLKEEQKLQRSIVESKEDASSQKRNAERLIKIFSDKGIQEILGPTAKPGVKAAFLEIASNPLDVAGNKVAITNLQKALVQSKATQEQIDKLNVANSTLRLVELSTAKSFLKGQGAVSNSERELVAEINGSVYKDPANALLYKAQLAFAQADMKDRYIKTFQTWKDKHPDGTVEQFNRTDAYNQIESSYGKQLEKIGETIKLGKPATKTETKSETPMSAIRNGLESLIK